MTITPMLASDTGTSLVLTLGILFFACIGVGLGLGGIAIVISLLPRDRKNLGLTLAWISIIIGIGPLLLLILFIDRNAVTICASLLPITSGIAGVLLCGFKRKP